MDPLAWSKSVAALGVDALIDHGLIRREDFEKATAIIAEEIHVRLCVGDYPSHVPGGSE